MYAKICSTSLAIMESNIKATSLCYYSATRMMNSFKIVITSREQRKRISHPSTDLGLQNEMVALKDRVVVPYKSNTYLLYNQQPPSWAFIPGKQKLVFTWSPVHEFLAPNWKWPVCLQLMTGYTKYGNSMQWKVTQGPKVTNDWHMYTWMELKRMEKSSLKRLNPIWFHLYSTLKMAQL